MSFPAINQGQNLSLSVDSFEYQSVKPLFHILKCLYFCLKEDLVYLIKILINCNMNNSVSFVILNAIKFVEQDYEFNYLYSYLITLKNNLAQKIQVFSSNYYRPNEVYYSLINSLKEETKNINFNINSNNFIPNLNLNLNNFPHVINNINYFLNEKKNHFVNLFFYLIIDISQCPQCSNVLKIDLSKKNEIQISGKSKAQENVSDLIYSSLKISSDEFLICNNCGINNKPKRFEYLLTLPRFLVVSCIGMEIGMKNVDLNINLKNFYILEYK